MKQRNIIRQLLRGELGDFAVNLSVAVLVSIIGGVLVLVIESLASQTGSHSDNWIWLSTIVAALITLTSTSTLLLKKSSRLRRISRSTIVRRKRSSQAKERINSNSSLQSKGRANSNSSLRAMMLIAGGALLGAFIQGFITELQSISSKTGFLVIYLMMGITGITLTLFGYQDKKEK